MQDDFQRYYEKGNEQDRLLQTAGRLEFARTQEILSRYLPQPPAVILDVGGGAGIHAFPLAERGYTVHLIDVVPLHIEQAQSTQVTAALASMQVGDARSLEFADASADAVLMLGPLYHLTERKDRMQALREALRVLKPGGWFFAATISRFASVRDGLIRGFMKDPYFAEIVERDLAEGQHRNPRQQPGYFATAYFHYPAEAREEVEEAGFTVEALLAIEGIGDLIPDFETFWDDPALRERLLHFLRVLEDEPTLLGITGHLMTAARKPC